MPALLRTLPSRPLREPYAGPCARLLRCRGKRNRVAVAPMTGTHHRTTVTAVKAGRIRTPVAPVEIGPLLLSGHRPETRLAEPRRGRAPRLRRPMPSGARPDPGGARALRRARSGRRVLHLSRVGRSRREPREFAHERAARDRDRPAAPAQVRRQWAAAERDRDLRAGSGTELVVGDRPRSGGGPQSASPSPSLQHVSLDPRSRRLVEV